MTSPEMTPPPVKKFAGRTHAATQKKPSASTSSALENLLDTLTIVQLHISLHTFERCAQEKGYDLGCLARSSQTATCGASESVCMEYLSTVFSGYTFCKAMVDLFKILPPFICNPQEMPDVSVYNNASVYTNNGAIKIPLLLGKVHSSPYARSIRKCVISVIDQLRLYHMINPNITSCIARYRVKVALRHTTSFCHQ